jgi:hypothetical protein
MRGRLGLLVSCFVVGSAWGAVYDVDRTDDTAAATACTAAANDCSLRGAIIAANANPGADTINLPAGTYALSILGAGEDNAATGDLDIRDDLTILGAGAATTTVDGSGIDRVFHSDPAGTGTITVSIQLAGPRRSRSRWRVRGQDAVIEKRVDARARHQRHEPLDQLQRRETRDVSCIRPRALQRDGHPSVVAERGPALAS